MCSWFRRRKPSRFDSPKMAGQASSDDFSSSFQSLSIQDQSSTGTQTTAPTQTSTQTEIPSQTVQAVPISKLFEFPAPNPPRCGRRSCGAVATWKEVKSTNQNGNVDRPFYVCMECKRNPEIPGSYIEKGWISWDDDVGIRQSNRACFCGFACRQDKAGVGSKYPGGGFWTCAIGRCKFTSFRRDALTDNEALGKGLSPYDDAFEPWLL